MISKEEYEKSLNVLEYLDKKEKMAPQEVFDRQHHINVTLIYHIQELQKRVQELENSRHLSSNG